MKSIHSMILASFLFAMGAHAHANESGIKRGMMFLNARNMLIKAGWKGIVVHQTASDDSDAKDYLDEQARPFYKLGVREVDMCAGGSNSTCTFHYRKGTECLTVVTYGETPHDTFVTHWMNTCGD